MAVPQTREQTADILRQGDRLGTAVPNLVIREDTQSEPGSSLNGENLAADLLRGYWPVLAGLVGLIVVVAISIRNFALAHRHGNQ